MNRKTRMSNAWETMPRQGKVRQCLMEWKTSSELTSTHEVEGLRRSTYRDLLRRKTEEEIELASRGVAPSERRLRTPERTPARRRRHPTTDRDSPRNRLVVDGENLMDSDDGDVVDATIENVDMQFDDDSGGGGGASASGAG